MAEWRSGAAGTASGLLTRCAVAPLDVIKIRLQLQVIEKTGRALGHAASAAPASVPGETAQKYRGVLPTLRVIVREEGAWALWKGNLTAEFLWGGYMGTQFLVYHMAQRAGAGVGAAGRAPGGQVGVDLACGAAAGAAATTATYPLDLLRTRLAAQQEPRVYRGLWHAAASVVRREGARRLYAGLSPALVQVAPYMGIQFSLYEACMRRLRPRQGKLPAAGGVAGAAAGNGRARPPGWGGALEPLWCGLVAGCVSKVCTLPLDVTKKRMQSGPGGGEPHAAEACSDLAAEAWSEQVLTAPRNPSWGGAASGADGTRPLPAAGGGAPLSMLRVCRAMLRHEGARVFLLGAVPAVIKTTLSSGLSFFFYENIMSALARLDA